MPDKNGRTSPREGRIPVPSRGDRGLRACRVTALLPWHSGNSQSLAAGWSSYPVSFGKLASSVRGHSTRAMAAVQPDLSVNSSRLWIKLAPLTARLQKNQPTQHSFLHAPSRLDQPLDS